MFQSDRVTALRSLIQVTQIGIPERRGGNWYHQQITEDVLFLAAAYLSPEQGISQFSQKTRKALRYDTTSQEIQVSSPCDCEDTLQSAYVDPRSQRKGLIKDFQREL